jgi:heme A synthase
MSRASDRLEALRREEWRRLRSDSIVLARSLGRTGEKLVAAHPYISLASAAALGVLATKGTKPRSREAAPSAHRGRAVLASSLLNLLLPSLLGGLEAAMTKRTRPESDRDSSLHSLSD